VDHSCRQNVIKALKSKLDETGGLLQGLEKRLKQTELEIADAERKTASVRVAMEEHREPLQLAKTRLRCRAMRPMQEKKRDLAEAALEAEVARVSIAASDLQDQLRMLSRNDAQLAGLHDELVADCEDKKHAHDIDVQCLRLQETVNTITFDRKELRSRSKGAGTSSAQWHTARPLFWDEKFARGKNSQLMHLPMSPIAGGRLPLPPRTARGHKCRNYEGSHFSGGMVPRPPQTARSITMSFCSDDKSLPATPSLPKTARSKMSRSLGRATM